MDDQPFDEAVDLSDEDSLGTSVDTIDPQHSPKQEVGELWIEQNNVQTSIVGNMFEETFVFCFLLLFFTATSSSLVSLARFEDLLLLFFPLVLVFFDVVDSTTASSSSSSAISAIAAFTCGNMLDVLHHRLQVNHCYCRRFFHHCEILMYHLPYYPKYFLLTWVHRFPSKEKMFCNEII